MVMGLNFQFDEILLCCWVGIPRLYGIEDLNICWLSSYIAYDGSSKLEHVLMLKVSQKWESFGFELFVLSRHTVSQQKLSGKSETNCMSIQNNNKF